MPFAICLILAITGALMSLQYGFFELTVCHIAPFAVLAVLARLKKGKNVEIMVSALAATMPLFLFHAAYLSNNREMDPGMGILAFTLPLQLAFIVAWAWGITERFTELKRQR